MIALKNKKVLLIAGAFCVVILAFSILILAQNTGFLMKRG